jgi:hypothetical protein
VYSGKNTFRPFVIALFLAGSLSLVACGSREATFTTGNVASTSKEGGDLTSSSSASPSPSEAPSGQLATTAAPPQDAVAEPGSCHGTIGAVAVDEVHVPENATCTLAATTVDGNVSVGHGATLIARGVSVNGDVEAEGATAVNITDGSKIEGNLQLEQGGSSSVSDTHIDGDLKWEEQSGPLAAEANTIGGNLQADRNQGPLTVSGNRILGDLECEENDALLVSAGNNVSGDAQGQCGK